MSIVALAFTVCAASYCGDPSPLAPATPRPEATITTAGECVRVQFQITGPSSVSAYYPQAGCTVGLVLIKSAGPTTWDGATRTLTVRLRIVNTTTDSVTLPVRLDLPADGKEVQLPLGTSADSIVPLNMDSTLADDRKVWLIGVGGSALAPGDSSETRTLTFDVKAPVTKGRLWFVSAGEEIVADTARPMIPAQTQWPTPILVTSPTDSSYHYLRDVFVVAFADTTSGATINSLLATFGGAVIGAMGGTRTSANPGYFIHIADPGPTWAAVDSVRVLMAQSRGVVSVGPLAYADPIRIRGQYPADAKPRVRELRPGGAQH